MLRDRDHVLDPILENIRLPELLDELNVQWKNEQQLREDFYEKIQPGDKWEFINGKTIMHSPAKEKHTEARRKLDYLLQTFVSIHDLGEVRSETSLVSLTRNDYLPDVMFFKKERALKLLPNTWKYPIPDFIVEILSKGTASTDKGIKKEDYASHGAQEYWLIDPDKKTIEQYILDKKTKSFQLFSKKTMDDNIACQVIGKCVFPVAAIFDEKTKMEVVKKWMGSWNEN